ncbi:hypothetical protein GMRT_14377 [Giardia muris]|uniref:Uncharacterized protein n=1 Tax=Giardia muris TaxID=5742 RepID=A0A4Z1ST99_GIAMU|nr:hypothetical protein GMRT_14377 [Giardia muris]|eukprot:TNJ28225.1 hypothetical protein GMRT_14377 [Giardia muris]
MLLNVIPTDTKYSFYFECDPTEETASVTARGLTLHNHIALLDSLVMPLEDLIKHGPLRKPEYKALEGRQEGEDELGPNQDEHHLRTGFAPNEAGTRTLTTALEEIKRVCKLGETRTPITLDLLKDTLAIVKGSILMTWPQNLPEYDPLREILDQEDEILRGNVDNQQRYYCVETGALFFAGKTLTAKGAHMSAIKCPPRTTLIVTPSRSQSYVPRQQEDAVRADVMKYMFEREKRLKEAELNTGEDAAAEAWADTRALKKQLLGSEDIRIK